MPASHSVLRQKYLGRLLRVAWPAERRITTTSSGLFCVLGDAGAGWHLEGLCLRLADAMAMAERLHAAPFPVAQLCLPRGGARSPASNSRLPDTYRISTDEGWSGLIYRAASCNSPFAHSHDPDEAVQTPAWRRLLKSAIAALPRNQLVLVMGEPGTGKSLFLRDLTRALTAAGEKPMLLERGEEIPPAKKANILLVDAADTIDQARLLAMAGTLSALGTKLVLACDPRWSLPARLADPAPAVVRLESFSVQDSARYLATRLRRAGRPPDWIEPEAVLRLHRHSGGVPRMLTALAGAATFLADLESSRQLSVRQVEYAACIARPGGAQILPRPPEKGAGQETEPARAWAKLRSSRASRLAVGAAGLGLVLFAFWGAQRIGPSMDVAAFARAGTPDSRPHASWLPEAVPAETAGPVEIARIEPAGPPLPRTNPPPEIASARDGAPVEIARLAPASLPQPGRVPAPETVPVVTGGRAELVASVPIDPATASSRPDRGDRWADDDTQGRAPDALAAEAHPEQSPVSVAAGSAPEPDLLARRFNGRLSVVSASGVVQRAPNAAPQFTMIAGVPVAQTGNGSVMRALLGSFTGAVSNQTLRLTGKLALDLSRGDTPGSVRARFRAWEGLLGTGQLSGTVSPDGRITLSGQLLMGRNPFNCELVAMISGDRIVGTARFVRPWGGRVAYSSFSLLRS